MIKKSTTLRVLIVDDEPLILLTLSRFLKKKMEVKTVASAEEAIDEIMAKHYDLCFLDISLPGMTGLEALKKIKRLSPFTKVTIMTGNFLSEAMTRQIDEAAYSFIEKPFELLHIQNVVNRVAATSIEQ